jgi:glutamate-1-semialdehyde 2,1-aminomutase
MEKEKSWQKITKTGKDIMAGWQVLAEKYGLSITINGLPALASFSFNSSNALAYKTLITQEMLEKGFLAGNSVYVCTAHSPEIISNFFEQLDSVFGLIKDCEEGRDIMSLLKGPVCDSGFKRVN